MQVLAVIQFMKILGLRMTGKQQSIVTLVNNSVFVRGVYFFIAIRCFYPKRKQ